MIHISRLSNSEPNFNEKNTVKQDWLVEVMGDHLALGQLLDFSLTSFQDTNDTLEICPHTCQALLWHRERQTLHFTSALCDSVKLVSEHLVFSQRHVPSNTLYLTVSLQYSMMIFKPTGSNTFSLCSLPGMNYTYDHISVSTVPNRKIRKFTLILRVIMVRKLSKTSNFNSTFLQES